MQDVFVFDLYSLVNKFMTFTFGNDDLGSRLSVEMILINLVQHDPRQLRLSPLLTHVSGLTPDTGHHLEMSHNLLHAWYETIPAHLSTNVLALKKYLYLIAKFILIIKIELNLNFGKYFWKDTIYWLWNLTFESQ